MRIALEAVSTLRSSRIRSALTRNVACANKPRKNKTPSQEIPEDDYTYRCAPIRWAGRRERGWWLGIRVLWSSATSMRWILLRAIDPCPRAPYFSGWPVQTCFKAATVVAVRPSRLHSPALYDVNHHDDVNTEVIGAISIRVCGNVISSSAWCESRRRENLFYGRNSWDK